MLHFIAALCVLVASVLIFETGISALLYRLTVERTPNKAKLFECICIAFGPMTYRTSFIAGVFISIGICPSWWPVLFSIAGMLPSFLYFKLGAKELFYISRLPKAEQHECSVIDNGATGMTCCLVGGGFLLGLSLLLAMRLM